MWLPVWDNALLSTTSYNIRIKVITMNSMNLHQMLFQIYYIHTYFYHCFYYISRNKKQFFQCKVVKCIFLVNYLIHRQCKHLQFWLHNCIISQILEKTPVLESLFNKAAGLRLENFLKRHFRPGVFLLILGNF